MKVKMHRVFNDESPTPSSCLFKRISEYPQIIAELGKGNLKKDFSLRNRKSKLSHSLSDILFDKSNDELSYFVLFMESIEASNYVKFLLDVNTFEKTFLENHSTNNSDFNVIEHAVEIYSKYIAKYAKYTINASDSIVSDTICKICPEKVGQRVEVTCFNASKVYVVDLIEKNFYEKYLTSEYHCKYLMKTLTSLSLGLTDFLYDDLAIVFLLEFLENEKVSELLKFWMQADNFSRNVLSKQTSLNVRNKGDFESQYKQWQNDAMIIYDNYISMQAKSALGFDSLVRRQVELNICTQIDSVDKQESLECLISSYANCFYVPMLIVYSVLERVFFKKFLRSELYHKFMRELANNSIIQNKLESSDLLHKLNPIKEDSSVKSVSNQINVKESNNMQFGSIDPTTGRFIRNFQSPLLENSARSRLDASLFQSQTENIWDLDMDVENRDAKSDLNKDKLNLKSKFDKLMSKIPLSSFNLTSNTKEDYEMAEQIAANIVKDVINSNKI